MYFPFNHTVSGSTKKKSLLCNLKLSFLSVTAADPVRNSSDGMKVGLLLALAVAALVPGLSESRIISRCELRDKLHQALHVPKHLMKIHSQLFALVSCEVDRRSQLNTNLVIVEGIRPTSAVLPAATDAPIMSPEEEFASTTTVSMSNIPGGRKKRSASENRSNKEDEEDSEEPMGVALNSEENKFNEEEMQQDDDRMESDNGEQSMESMMKPWSLGYYGVFQLSDSHFCNSGFRWSRNVCHKNCSAFTDDNITDDVTCFIKSGYWRLFLRDISRSCYHQRKTYFASCD
ncbi:uncharacterized protein LOC112157301 isoform X1 [Oryzias melastigma]|uniref:uncharacterized protein LOC112157301 isoform X1 n=2 Tax=Oryzias melastigma TaxID=30732 RepID=UPI000CF82F50|nr:uncharacterized protein LOC112157301 isoform X1 [Oryzias melastigma]